MTRKSYLNPQPFAVDRENKQCVKDKPSNLAGTEVVKNQTGKIKKALNRLKNI